MLYSALDPVAYLAQVGTNSRADPESSRARDSRDRCGWCASVSSSSSSKFGLRPSPHFHFLFALHNSQVERNKEKELRVGSCDLNPKFEGLIKRKWKIKGSNFLFLFSYQRVASENQRAGNHDCIGGSSQVGTFVQRDKCPVGNPSHFCLSDME